jgi:two-component system LytT family response regulator
MKDIIKLGIVDDEQHSIDALLWELEAVQVPFSFDILFTSTKPTGALETLRHDPPDILFLDVEMPGMSGIDLLTNLSKFSFEVIFTTAYDKYAFKAFQFSAFGYLLKPVDHESLQQCLMKYASQLSMQEKLKLATQTDFFGKISIPTLEGFEFVDIDQIIRIEANSNYTILYLTENRKIIVSKTMADIEKKLPATRFFRTHKSHIIQLSYVHKYLRGKLPSLMLVDGSTIPVSPNKKDLLLNALKV